MKGPADLLARELLIFVGKGGVGKTTTASAIALHLAAQGRRTLLVTVDPAKRLKDSLGVDVGHRVRTVRENLGALMLDPEKVIEEYLREKYPDQNLVGHPFYKYLSNYMPGINELLAIGKLIEFRQEKDFDTIVVDTAPTGHALSFLTTPMKVRDLFRENQLLRWAIRGYSLYRKISRGGRAIGKLFKGDKDLPEAPDVDFETLFKKISEHVGSIQDLLADPKKTTLSIVTVPETLPVEETCELHEYITKNLHIHVGYVIVNKVQPDAMAGLSADFRRLERDAKTQEEASTLLFKAGYPEELLGRLLESVEFNQVRREMNLAHIQDLEKRLPNVSKVLIPLHRKDIAGIERLELFAREFWEGMKAVPAPVAKSRAAAR